MTALVTVFDTLRDHLGRPMAGKLSFQLGGNIAGVWTPLVGDDGTAQRVASAGEALDAGGAFAVSLLPCLPNQAYRVVYPGGHVRFCVVASASSPVRLELIISDTLPDLDPLTDTTKAYVDSVIASVVSAVAPSGDTTGMTDTAALQTLIDAGTAFATGPGLFHVANLVLRSGTHWRWRGSTLQLPNGSPAGSRVIVSDQFDKLVNDLVITNVSTANPGVVTTATPHGRVTGDYVTIAGVLGAVEANASQRRVTNIDATHFSIAVNVVNTYTGGGTVVTYGGGISDYHLTGKGLVDGNAANNPAAGEGVAIYGYGGLTTGIDVNNCAKLGWRNEWRQATYPPPSGSKSTMASCQMGANGTGGLLWNGPNDSRIIDVTAPMNSGIGIHAGPNAQGTFFSTGCHAWSSAAITNFIPWMLESQVELDGCEAAGYGTTAPVQAAIVVLASGCRIEGGIQYASSVTIPGAVGIQVGTLTAIAGALGPAATGAVQVGGTKISTKINHCGAGAINFANSGGTNIVARLDVYANSGVVIANQANMTAGDTLGLITFTGGVTGPSGGNGSALAAANINQGTTWKTVTFLPSGTLSGQYIIPLSPEVATTSAILGIGTERTSPWYCPVDITVVAVSVPITVAGDAGCKYRPIIRADDGTFYPGAVLLDVGQLPADAVAVPEAAGLSTALIGGTWYWLGGAVQLVTTQQPSVEVVSAGTVPFPFPPRFGTSKPGAAVVCIGYQQTGVTAAPPNTFSPTVLVAGLAPRLRLRIA